MNEVRVRIVTHATGAEGDRGITPGPNNPVGVAWLNLSRKHYGIKCWRLAQSPSSRSEALGHARRGRGQREARPF